MTKLLPAWVEWGAWLLAFNAGGINAVGLLSLEHQALSHVTGSGSWLGLELARGNGGQALHLVLVIVAFFAGAVLSGCIIKDGTLDLTRRYGLCLLIEAGLLMAALQGFRADAETAALWASAACGTQNAMVSTYSGTVLRTTHITGTVTDLGITLGHWLRRLPVDWRRLRLQTLLVSGFLAGATGGAAAWLHWSFTALWLPVVICLGLAAAHISYLARRHQLF
ncbi:MAG: YoaK family protein [Pseudomonadota bacterium]